SHARESTRRGGDRGGGGHIRVRGVARAAPPRGLEEVGELRPPHRDADPVIAFAQRADYISAQKPRSAENRDECVQIRCHWVHSCAALPNGRFVSGRCAMRNRPLRDDLTSASSIPSNRLQCPGGGNG